MLARSIALLYFLAPLIQSSSSAALPSSNSSPKAITGPVFSHGFADPSILEVDGKYYAFATNQFKDSKINVPVAKSNNFETGWALDEKLDALPDPGPWVEKPDGHVWDPDVSKLKDGSFIMYYAAIPTKQVKGTTKDKHCIGAAVSPDVTGPFKPQDKPLLCPPGGKGTGAIGPDAFVAPSGERYVVFKNGSAFDPEHTSHVALQKVGDNGYDKEGDFQELVHSTQAGDNDTEGPAIVARPGGGFALLFVVGFYKSTDYRIEYATADNILGPYERQGVLLHTGTWCGVKITAPGGPDFVNGNPRRIIFMADKDGGYGVRQLHTAILQYNGNQISLASCN